MAELPWRLWGYNFLSGPAVALDTSEGCAVYRISGVP